MTVIHVQPMISAQGRHVHLVVPIPFDGWFADVLFRNLPRFGGVKVFSGMGGWEIDGIYQEALLRVIQSNADWPMCTECFYSPCEAWVQWVCRRYTQWQDAKTALPPPPRYTSERAFDYTRRADEERRSAQEQAKRLLDEENQRREAVQRAVKERTSKALKILGIEEGYTRDSLIKAFRKAVMKAHPDRGGTDAEMIRVVEAKDLLLGKR